MKPPIILLLFIEALILNAQSTHLDLVLKDSTFISDYYYGNQHVLNGDLCFFDYDSMLLYRFNKDFEIKDSIKFEKPKIKQFRGVHPFSVYTDSTSYWLMSISRDELLEYSAYGHFIRKIKIDLKLSGKRYMNENNAYTVQSEVFDKSSKNLLINLKPMNRLNAEKDRYYEKCFPLKYHSKSVIGVVSKDGKLSKVFGEYADIYKRKPGLSYLDDTFFDKYDELSIIYTNQLSDNMVIYNTVDGSIRKVGEKGKYINSSYDSLPEIHNREELFLKEYAYLIESPYYSSLNVTEKFVIRTYSIAIKDTVKVDQNDVETKLKWLRGELKGCLLASKTEKQQQNLWLNKPYFVQIYDRKSMSLLYDGYLGHCFPVFIRADGNKLYFYKGIGKRIVYEYQLQ